MRYNWQKLYFSTLTAANARKTNCWKEIRKKRPKASFKETILRTVSFVFLADTIEELKSYHTTLYCNTIIPKNRPTCN